jgi:type II secretion system protein N
VKLPRLGKPKLPRFKTETGVPRVALEWLGYGAFFIGFFIFSVMITFPYERLRDYAVAKVAAMPHEQGESPLRLSIEDIGPAWPPGVELDGVRLERDAKVKDGVAVAVTLDEVEVHPALFASIFGKLSVGFEIESGDGSIEGNFAMRDEGWAVDAELDEMDLDALGAGGWLGAPVRGSASGHIAFEMGAEPVNDEGSIEVSIEGVKIGDGKTKAEVPGLSQGFTLEPIDAGRLEVHIPVKQGVAALEKLEAKGKDLELRGSGSVRLIRPLSQSRADVTLEVDFKDSYKKRSDRTKAMFQLLSAQPVARQATTSSGAMRFALRGPLEAMRARPAGAARAAGAAAPLPVKTKRLDRRKKRPNAEEPKK